ncbi:hypothetical protein ALNOE001_01500 [Candidatus Methanobinarius endosymbioticus]|uniref:Bacterial Ig-like domain-containing protein n=1 Tax=Candidatus Methanobinarius endosymbioticus TaxID=2006182 RepID=A0A366ME88_9EURY|nr:hypothetical protein ALNOE001_01500 [Candidatus Methanobinarius endosymbioticus]
MNVLFFIGNINIGNTTTNNEGIDTFTFTVNSTGIYSYFVSYMGNINFDDSSSDNNSLIFNKINNSIIYNIEGDVKSGNTVKLTSYLDDEYGNGIGRAYLSFYVNNEFIGMVKTNNYGMGIFNYKLLEGENQFRFEYNGNEIYTSVSEGFNINIPKK